MYRYQAQIQFDTNCLTFPEIENIIKNCSRIHNVQITNLKQVSITPEEAIREIKILIQEEGAYDGISSSKIQAILNRVI